MSRSVAAVLVALALATGACGGASGPSPTASPTPRPRPLPPVAKTSADITDRTFHVGQEAFITDDGLVPERLVSIVQEEISFINETNKARTVVLDVLRWKRKIAPGDRAVYVPEGAYSIAYHVDGKPEWRAQIQVEPYFDPGEDPGAEHRLDADTPGERPVTASPSP